MRQFIGSTNVLTATARFADLEAVGVTGEAARLIVKQTSGERAHARTQVVVDAAEAYLREAVPYTPETAAHDKAEAYLGMAFVLLADMVGVGGTDGIEGAATMRHPELL